MPNHQTGGQGPTHKNNSQQDKTNLQHDDAERKSQKTKDHHETGSKTNPVNPLSKTGNAALTEKQKAARALRNKPQPKNNFGGDAFSLRGQKTEKPKAGVKSTMRKPSV